MSRLTTWSMGYPKLLQALSVFQIRERKKIFPIHKAKLSPNNRLCNLTGSKQGSIPAFSTVSPTTIKLHLHQLWENLVEMIYWSNQQQRSIFIVAQGLQSAATGTGFGPEAFFQWRQAEPKFSPLIRLALHNSVTDMTNRCIRACHLFPLF